MLIPIIRKQLPIIVAEDIAGVQPMTGSGRVFTLRALIGVEPTPPQGDRRHSFLEGWQRYYGSNWIPESLWITIKLKGL